MNSTINRGNAARALLEHGGHAPWWFDLWGESAEYAAGGAVQREVTVEGDTVRLRPGAAIYRRDLRRVSGDVSVLIGAGGIAAAGRVLSFELHLEIGSAVPQVTWDDSITWEDFGWPHLEANRTAVFFFRSTDGGATWTGGRAVSYAPFKYYRGGAVQRAVAVTDDTVRLEEDASVYRLDLTGRTGTVEVGLDAGDPLGGYRCNVTAFELHITAGKTAPQVSLWDGVKFEDFGGLWRLETNRTTVLYCRSADGGETWTAGVMYTYGPPIVFRGGAVQRFAEVSGGDVVLREDAAIYRLDLRRSAGTVPVTLTAPERPIIRGGNAIEAELHFRCGAEAPKVSFGDNVTYEDFGGLWRLEAGRVTAAAARSFDGGRSWKIGKLYTYKER